MTTIKLVVECFKTIQVSEDHWKDGTTYTTVEVLAPDWLAKGLDKGHSGGFRIIGSETLVPEQKED